MAEPATPAPPSLAEARGWIGDRVDAIDGADIGLVHGLFADAEDGKPSWLIVRQGRFKGTLVAIPIANCAAAGGRVWVAHERDPIRSAPVVDPTRPLLREHELTICSHFGIGEGLGRATAVTGRKEGSVTSEPVP
jgi:hypothetical protein